MRRWLCLWFAIFSFFLVSGTKANVQPTITLKKVNLATDEWPPYVGKGLKGNGFIYEIVRKTFVDAGYEVHIVYLPWSDATQLVKFNNNGYFPAYDTDMDHNVLCSIAMPGGPVGLYRRKNDFIRYTVSNPGKEQENAFRGLQKYRFGVVEGYGNTTAFDKASYLTKITVDSDYDNLKQLQDNKVDLAFSDVFVAEYLIEHNPDLTNIEFMGPSLENKQFYVCLSKFDPDTPQILSDFNIALKNMLDSGEFDNITFEYAP